MRHTARMLLALLTLLSSACASLPPAKDAAILRAEVVAAETAFAQSMADRNNAAFDAFIADDAVFLNGDKPLRGKAAITAHWARFFTKPEAPFYWKPVLVEVLADGSLAQSSGPVTLADGTLIARFISVWRREATGAWKIIFDQGYDVCPPAQP